MHRLAAPARRLPSPARRLAAAALLLALGAGCEPDPCYDYIDYMCDCHDGEDGISCEEYENTYSNAGADLQDECEIALEDQIDQDIEDGVECDGDPTTEE